MEDASVSLIGYSVKYNLINPWINPQYYSACTLKNLKPAKLIFHTNFM